MKWESIMHLLRTRGDPLAFEHILRVDHRPPGHGRLGPHCCRIVVRTVEVELAGQFHIELTFANQMPVQQRAAEASLDRRAGGVDGLRYWRERRAEVAGLLGSQAF